MIYMDNNLLTNVNPVNEEAIKSMNTENAIYFNFSYSALKLLGKNLYSNAANAISELVANALDAKAPEVYVYIDMSDKKHSIIEILDNGSGMDYDDLADKYVWIGRNKREDGELTATDKQTVMGRKGIGKLAALYLSNKYFIITRKKNETVANKWEVNLSKYKDSDFPRLDKVTDTINLVNNNIWERFTSGTAIKLENVDLRRNGAQKIEGLRRVFADFYLIDSLKSTIYVSVKTSKNDKVDFKPVKKRIAYKNFYALFDNSDLNIASKMSNNIIFSWASQYEHIANAPRETKIIDKTSYKTSGKFIYKFEDDTQIEKDYSLTGWIAIHSTIEQKNAVDEKFIRNSVYQPNRLRLYVRNKLAVADYFVISPSTQAMANYIEGEITFDILDDDDLPDIATSSRQDFLDDDRITLLTSIVDPILTRLFSLRNKVGREISEESEKYYKYLLALEEEKRKAEAEARAKAEEEAKAAEKAKEEAEQKQKAAEAEAQRERKRSQYILSVSDVDNKNVLNSVHSIYNMSNRVKENLDDINNLPELTSVGRKKLEKAATSNQRILSVSKLIAKAGRVIDNNDAIKEVNLTTFVNEYVNDVLSRIYEDDIQIECVGDISSDYFAKIKPLSFIMLLDNLIGNAIKANAKKLTIIIDDSKSDEYVLAFEDNGNGIDPSITDLEHLFDFGVTTTNGSGLGLYYARKQMKSLKGTITIKRNTNKGATIILCWGK